MKEKKETLIQTMFVFCDCLNKFLKTWGLKITEINFLTVLEARMSTSVSLGWNKAFGQGHVFSGGSAEESVPCFFQFLAASVCSSIPGLKPYHPNLSLHLYIALSSVCVTSPSFVSLILVLVVVVRAYLDNPG